MCSADPGPQLWSVTFRPVDTCIGQVALVPEQQPNSWWLSYWLAPSHWGAGVAGESIAALLSAAFDRANSEHIVAVVSDSNLRSIALLNRLGFTQSSGAAPSTPIPEGHLCYTLQSKNSPR
jgi:RimJ/RimL family protein N-acetyltransferase